MALPPRLVFVHGAGGTSRGWDLWSALSYPADLAGLVLIATGARLRVAPAILEELASDYPAAVDTIIARSLAPDADPRLARRLREAMLAVPADVTGADFHACDGFDVMGRLDEIRVPALVIVGREDQMTPPRYAEYLHAHMPACRLVSVEGAGHMVQVERPKELNEAIRCFLDTIRETGKGGK